MKHTDIVSLVIHGVAVPLINAVMNGSHSHDEDTAIDHVSELLIQASQTVRKIDQESALTEKPLTELSDRMDLLATCCHILSNDYIQNERIPKEGEIRQYAASLNALLLTHHTNKQQTEDFQNGLRYAYLESYAPLIEVIHIFSFGKNESQMIQDVSKNIEDATNEIYAQTYGDKAEKFARHHLRSALITLYAASHNKEVKRISALSDYQRDHEKSSTQIDNIQTDFGLRKDMLAVIAHTMREENIPESSGIEIPDDLTNDVLNLDESLSDDLIANFLKDPANEDLDDSGEEDKGSPMSFYRAK